MEARGAREYTFWSIGMVLILLFALIPVIWIVSLSFKTPATIADKSFFPQEWTFDNYEALFDGRPLGEPVPRAADQLDPDRDHRHLDRDRARRVLRLRDRPPRLPGQGADPGRRAGDRDVPGDLHRGAAVRHVADARASTTPTRG